jgi:hypothetical protein
MWRTPSAFTHRINTNILIEMKLPLIKVPALRCAPARLFLVFASLFISQTSFAKLAANTIDPVGIVSDNGRHVALTGPVSATSGDRVEMQVMVTQRSTGAVAEGIVFFTGTGEVTQWAVTAATCGPAAFEPGPATVVALALTSVKGQPDDAHQWLVNVTLVNE